MGFIIETFRWCQANEFWQTTAEGSQGDTYTVMFTNQRGWECSCPGYKFRKFCKHIAAAEEQKCDHGWEAVCGSPVDDWVGDERLCPKCGGPSRPVRVAI